MNTGSDLRIEVFAETGWHWHSSQVSWIGVHQSEPPATNLRAPQSAQASSDIFVELCLRQKIAQVAEAEGIKPIDMCDRYCPLQEVWRRSLKPSPNLRFPTGIGLMLFFGCFITIRQILCRLFEDMNVLGPNGGSDTLSMCLSLDIVSHTLRGCECASVA